MQRRPKQQWPPVSRLSRGACRKGRRGGQTTSPLLLTSSSHSHTWLPRHSGQRERSEQWIVWPTAPWDLIYEVLGEPRALAAQNPDSQIWDIGCPSTIRQPCVRRSRRFRRERNVFNKRDNHRRTSFTWLFNFPLIMVKYILFNSNIQHSWPS